MRQFPSWVILSKDLELTWHFPCMFILDREWVICKTSKVPYVTGMRWRLERSLFDPLQFIHCFTSEHYSLSCSKHLRATELLTIGWDNRAREEREKRKMWKEPWEEAKKKKKKKNVRGCCKKKVFVGGIKENWGKRIFGISLWKQWGDFLFSS